jgi:hypothetical protein
MSKLQVRLWDKKKKQMHYKDSMSLSLFISLNGGIWQQTDNLVMDNWTKRTIVQQFIGYKDTHDKKIYVGDIIEFYDLYGKQIGLVYYDDVNCCFSVKYQYCNQDNVIFYKYQPLFKIDKENILVIGNLYESNLAYTFT